MGNPYQIEKIYIQEIPTKINSCKSFPKLFYMGNPYQIEKINFIQEIPTKIHSCPNSLKLMKKTQNEEKQDLNTVF